MGKDAVTELEEQLEEQIHKSYKIFRIEISKHNERLNGGILRNILQGLAFVGSPLIYILKLIFGF